MRCWNCSALLLAWFLVGSSGPISPFPPFPTLEACEDMAGWLNGQLDQQLALPDGTTIFYRCEEGDE